MVDWGEGSTQVTCTFGGGGKMEKVVQKKKKKKHVTQQKRICGGCEAIKQANE